MLKKIRLKDFKSFVDEEVELAPLTLLVGANASGKSNFLDALRFLQGISSDLTLAEILNGEDDSRPGAWAGVRGRAQEAARLKTRQFTIRSTWQAPRWVRKDLREKFGVIHSLSCQTEPSPRLLEEVFSDFDGKNPIFARPAADGQIEISSGEETAPALTHLSADKSVLKQAEDGVRAQLDLAQKYPDLIEYRLALRYHLDRIRFLEHKPERMRGYGRRGASLGNEASNFSGVLAELCSDPNEKQILIEWISEFVAPELQDIEFEESKALGDVMAFFVEGDGRRISARSISDGTLHFLGLLLALRTAEEGSLHIMEEIGSGLHPTRIRLLVDFLGRVADARQIQIIATTHSPVVLQWLSEADLKNVVAFGRVPEHEGTLMRRLGDLPHFSESVARAGIEELFTSGWLEMAL